jgi:hypothetical protein
VWELHTEVQHPAFALKRHMGVQLARVHVLVGFLHVESAQSCTLSNRPGLLSSAVEAAAMCVRLPQPLPNADGTTNSGPITVVTIDHLLCVFVPLQVLAQGINSIHTHLYEFCQLCCLVDGESSGRRCPLQGLREYLLLGASQLQQPWLRLLLC